MSRSLLHKEQLKLGRYLWERINATDDNDHEALRALGGITFSLMEEFGGKYIRLMHELHMWIGLKRDAPGQFDDYGEGLKTDCPEFFSEDRSYYTGPDH